MWAFQRCRFHCLTPHQPRDIAASILQPKWHFQGSSICVGTSKTTSWILLDPCPELRVLLTQGTYTQFVPCTIPNINVNDSTSWIILWKKLWWCQKWFPQKLKNFFRHHNLMDGATPKLNGRSVFGPMCVEENFFCTFGKCYKNVPV